jgi:hypothetical protein
VTTSPKPDGSYTVGGASGGTYSVTECSPNATGPSGAAGSGTHMVTVSWTRVTVRVWLRLSEWS